MLYENHFNQIISGNTEFSTGENLKSIWYLTDEEIENDIKVQTIRWCKTCYTFKFIRFNLC